MAEENILVDQRDLVSKLTADEKAVEEFRLQCICPDDGKYGKSADSLRPYLSSEAEWRACALIQRTLLQIRVDIGQVDQKHLNEVDAALEKISPLNMKLLEEKVTKHDQLAVLEEIGRFVSPETKALLHPGTTSYDILDTARSYLFKKAWGEVIRPAVAKSIEKLCELSEQSINVLQVGRTHLQNTSPVLFGGVLAGYAARLADRVERCDLYFDDLRGKISGIVGTGASIEMVIGEGKAMTFEREALEKLGLKPDYTATQIVQKERLADVGHGLVTLMNVLGDFANDMRLLYSSAIGEVSDRESAERLGGSSADAGKNNPINWENICGKVAVVESGMRVLYAMIQSDLQRDLRNSVQGRYQPGMMMTEIYESFCRTNKALKTLSINEDRMAANLEPVRNNPSEAMVAILRGQGWVHSKYGVGHDFVKEMGKKAKKEGRGLLGVCFTDSEFTDLYDNLPEVQRQILDGKIENYVGPAATKALDNIKYARRVVADKK